MESLKPKLETGALVGLIVGLPVLAIQAVVAALIGTAFIPFVLFDFIARVTPGALITQAIDTMVNTLVVLGLSVADTAKTVEQAAGIVMVIIAGALVGLLIFAIKRNTSFEAVGVGIGLMAGLAFNVMLIVVRPVLPTGIGLNFIWGLITTLALCYAIDYIYEELGRQKSPTVEMSAEQNQRRQFLIKAGTTSAAVTVVGAGLAGVLSTAIRRETVADVPANSPDGTSGQGSTAAPNASNYQPIAAEIAGIVGGFAVGNPDAELEPAPGTRPEITPLDDHYQIDINSIPPRVEENSWRLLVTGLVDNPREFTLSELVEDFEQVDEWVTLSCISNFIGGDLIGTTRWTGLRLADLLDAVGLQERASHIRMDGADGFFEYLDLNLVREDDRIMLAYAWDGQALKQKHGFPLRIWLPDHYGMKQPKWLTSLDVIDENGDGYWVRRGWSRTALMNQVSVVDTIAVDDTYEEEGQMYVPIGGMAHAGDRSISKVEVRVDNGEWVEAEIRQPLGEATWVLWRYDWAIEPGDHEFAVRSVDGNAEPQEEFNRVVRPDGATGIHSARANFS